MSINTNRWNRIRYTLYAPIYDLIAGYFKASRKKSIEALHIQTGERILIVGAGTGLDLEFFPQECEIVATDITPAMIERLKKRNSHLKRNVDAKVMDGQNLEFPDGSFDKVILHLILAVIPDPIACIKEAERVLQSGGQITVFDKFVKKDLKASIFRKFINLFTASLFSDITRSIESIVQETDLTIVTDEDANFYGNFRILLLKKP